MCLKQVILCLALALSLSALTVAQVPPHSLLLGEAVEAQLSGSAAHNYPLKLAAGECARMELKADKARLNLSVLSEKNELIATISEADSPNLKRLDIVAERATNYVIRVALEYDKAPTAKYQLTLVERRAATAQDRERFALHILDWEVVRLFRQQEKSALQQAIDKGREAAARWQALGEPEHAGRMLDRVGRSLFLLSQLQESRAAYEQAIAAFRQAGARLAEATSLNNLATLSYNSGDYQTMLLSGLRAQAIWQAVHDEAGLRMVRFQQARLYAFLGEWQKAEDLCRQLLPETGTGRVDEWDQVYREDVLTVWGIAALGRGEARRGLNYLNEALVLLREADDVIIKLIIFQQLSLAWQKLGDQVQALDYLQQSLVGSKRLGLREGETESYYKLGRLYVALGRRNEARAAFSEAVNAGAHSGKRYLSIALLGLARFQHEQGEQTAALANVEQALPIIESLGAQIPIDAVRASFQTQERDAYELRTDLLLHLHERQPAAGHDAAALQSNEAARARSLMQLLSEKHLLPTPALDPALTGQVDELRRQIAARTSEQIRLRQGSAASVRLAEIKIEVASLLAELDRLSMMLRNQQPRDAALTMPAPLSLREIQQVLDCDTLLLEYTLGEERSTLFVVTPDALHTFSLPSRTVIEPLARQAYEALSRSQQPKVFANLTAMQAWRQRNERAYAQAAAQLSKLILAPAAALLGNKRLLIVPDGALHYVSFAALPECGVWNAECGVKERAKTKNPKATQTAVKNLPSAFRTPHSALGTPNSALVENHEIAVLPSASTLLAQWRENAGRAQAPKMLAMVADPVFQANDKRIEKTGPSLAVTFSDRVRGFALADESGALSIPRLPASRIEAEAILSLVAPDASKAALDFDASYQTVTQSDLSQYRFVHFATHGLLDETHPELSGLLFSQVDRQGAKVEGYFTTLDAFKLKLNADLVVLSGCRTALGKEVKGEGMMGLTRGFMYAGARRVLASLWQVNDDATAELMKRFYQNMLGEQKLQPAAALRAAQLEIRRDPRWQSPYYWAAFVLQGDW